VLFAENAKFGNIYGCELAQIERVRIKFCLGRLKKKD
jgi:hypothetical protein